jgi:hypothetical protein
MDPMSLNYILTTGGGRSTTSIATHTDADEEIFNIRSTRRMEY